ncbi:MAG: serine/threonine-protein kinase [Dongiaceae bacterium]
MADDRDADEEPTLGPGLKTARPPTLAGGKPTTIAPGQLLGHTYRIEALLARGGMGEVYRARHAELDTEHAIKIILPELVDDAKIVDLFRREASVLRTIRHEAIVGYEGVFRDENGRLYLVMEFVDGPSLSKVLKQGPMPPPQLRRLRDRLADGLAAAHEKGVIHRDLSPDNVILPGGDIDKAKIIDFGISKLADPEVKTIVGDDFAGKYSYVSPEQVGLYGGRVDARSDIYSLGLVLAAVALGKPLDMGSSPITVVEARRGVPNLERLPRELRDELAAMLQPDPANRPPSMRALVPDAVRPQQRADSGRVRGAAGAGALAPASPRAGSGARAAVAAVALVLLLAAGGGVGYWLFAPSPEPPIPDVPDPPDPPVDRIGELTKGANLALQGFQCARLSVQVSPAGDIEVRGWTGSEADKTAVASRLAAVPGAGRISDQVAVMRSPLCDALGLLHGEISSRPNDPAAPRIDPGGAAGTYFGGDSLRIGVTATSLYDGHLYVDYIDGQEGYVVHLFPNELRADDALRAGSRIDIGSLPQEAQDYVVRPPFGSSLIVAVSTPEPLFSAPRPRVEADAKKYLADLRRELQRLAASGYQNSLLGSYSVLQLRER